MKKKFWRSKSAETFYNNLPADMDDPMAMVFKDSMQTVLKSRSKSNLNERLSNIMATNIEKQMSVIEKILHFWQLLEQQHLLLDYLVQFGE